MGTDEEKSATRPIPESGRAGGVLGLLGLGDFAGALCLWDDFEDSEAMGVSSGAAVVEV